MGFSEVNALFKVLSWKPRALYFPNFASSEKCEAIVRLAKTKLRPSTLALRKGETSETTKGIRTRYDWYQLMIFVLCFIIGLLAEYVKKKKRPSFGFNAVFQHLTVKIQFSLLTIGLNEC